MREKYVNTLVALALLGALWGTITYWEKRKSRQATKIESTPQEKILSLDSNHIQSFTIKPREGQTFTCHREGGNWGVVEPRKLLADQSNISSFLNSLTTATVDQVVEPHPANLKDFGLNPPVMSVEVITDAKPEKFTLRLGDETPTSGGVYAQIAGSSSVISLASYQKSSLEKSLFDLRDKRAVTLDTDRVQRIEMESKGKRWTLVKNPEGVWDLVLPPPVRADRITVDSLVSSLRTASMQAVVAEDKKEEAKYGFGSPTLRVRLSGPGATQTLLLGKKEGERYDAMNSAVEPIFTLNADFLTQFQKDPADLRDKDLFSFSSFDAKRVEVDTPKGHQVFELQKDKWKRTTPSATDEPTEKLDTLLNRLRDLRATSFPKNHPSDLAAFRLTKPAYRFQVQFGEKSQTENVDVSKVGDHIFARRSTDPVASEISKASLEEIEKALNDL